MKLLSENNETFVPIQVIPQETTLSKKREIGSANMLLGQLPTLAGAKELSTAYKVVFPAGVTGKLMTLKNGANAGLATTSVIGESGKIAGQAGLQSLSNFASPLAVFSALSMITGQYFMAEINKSIKALSENIEEVQKQIDTSEESVVFSASIFLQEIKNDWNLILESENFKLSVISNIIKTVNDLTSSCYYFENRLNTKMSELKTNLQKNKISEDMLLSEINRNKEFLKQAYELRSCLKLILIFLTSGVTESNSEDIKQAIKKDEDLLFSVTVKQLEHKIDEIIELIKSAPSLKMQKQGLEIKENIISIRNITRDRYNNLVNKNITETIERIEKIDRDGQTFFIEGDKLYIEEIA